MSHKAIACTYLDPLSFLLRNHTHSSCVFSSGKWECRKLHTELIFIFLLPNSGFVGLVSQGPGLVVLTHISLCKLKWLYLNWHGVMSCVRLINLDTLIQATLTVVMRPQLVSKHTLHCPFYQLPRYSVGKVTLFKSHGVLELLLWHSATSFILDYVALKSWKGSYLPSLIFSLQRSAVTRSFIDDHFGSCSSMTTLLKVGKVASRALSVHWLYILFIRRPLHNQQLYKCLQIVQMTKNKMTRHSALQHSLNCPSVLWSALCHLPAPLATNV